MEENNNFSIELDENTYNSYIQKGYTPEQVAQTYNDYQSQGYSPEQVTQALQEQVGTMADTKEQQPQQAQNQEEQPPKKVNPIKEGIGSIVQGLIDIPQEGGEFLGRYVTNNLRPLFGKEKLTEEQLNEAYSGKLSADKIDIPFLPEQAEQAFIGVTTGEAYKPQTQVGEGIRVLTKYLAPSVKIGLMADAMKAPTALKWITGIAGAGAVDATLYDSQTEFGNVANIVNSAVPNPISAFIATDKDDSDLEARFKNALDGFIVGETLGTVLKTVKGYKTAFKEGKIEEFAKANAEDLVKTNAALNQAAKNIDSDNFADKATEVFYNAGQDYDVVDKFIKDNVPADKQDEVLARFLGKSDETYKFDPTTNTMKIRTSYNELSLSNYGLDKSAPKYGAGKQGLFDVNFESDIDKALYVVANRKNLSGADDKFVTYLKEVFPKLSDKQIIDLGGKVKKEIGTNLKNNGYAGDSIDLPKTFEKHLPNEGKLIKGTTSETPKIEPKVETKPIVEEVPPSNEFELLIKGQGTIDDSTVKALVQKIRTPEQLDQAFQALTKGLGDLEKSNISGTAGRLESEADLELSAQGVIQDFADTHGIDANDILLSEGWKSVDDVRKARHKFTALRAISKEANAQAQAGAKLISENGFDANIAAEMENYKQVFKESGAIVKAGGSELGRGLRSYWKRFAENVDPSKMVQKSIEAKLPTEQTLDAIGTEMSETVKPLLFELRRNPNKAEELIRQAKDKAMEVAVKYGEYKPAEGIPTRVEKFVDDTVSRIKEAKTEDEALQIVTNNAKATAKFDMMKNAIEADNIIGLFSKAKNVMKTTEEVLNTTFVNNVFSPITHVTNFASGLLFNATHSPALILGGIRNGDAKAVTEGFLQSAVGFSNLLDTAIAGIKSFKEEESILTPSPRFLNIQNKLFNGTEVVKPLSAKHFGLQGKNLITDTVDGLGVLGRLNSRTGIALDELTRQFFYRNAAKSNAMMDAYAEVGLKDYNKYNQRVNELFNSYFDGQGRATNKDLAEIAEEYAARGSKETLITEAGKGLNGLASHIPVVGKILLPFVNTTANLLQLGAEFSPTSILQKRFYEELKAGGRSAALAKGRLQLGTSMMLAVSGLAMNGHITGSLPSDPKARQEAIEAGMKEYSIVYDTATIDANINELQSVARRYGLKGNDKTTLVNSLAERGITSVKTYRSYLRLQPFGMLAGIAADLTDLSQNLDDYKDAGAIGTEVWDTFMQAAMNTTYVRTIKEQLDLISPQGKNLIETTDENGEYKLTANPKSPSGKYIAKLLPALIPLSYPAMQKYFGDDGSLKETYSIMDSLKQTYPLKLLDDGIPIAPKRDFMTGQPLYKDSHFLGFMETVRTTNHPVYEELRRLSKSGKGLTIPDVPQGYKEINFLQFRNDKKQDARDAIRELIGSTSFGGKTLENTLTEQVQSDFYKSLPDGTNEATDQKAMTKEKWIHKVYKDYYDNARSIIMYEHPEFKDINGRTLQQAETDYEMSRDPFSENKGTSQPNNVQKILEQFGVKQ